MSSLIWPESLSSGGIKVVSLRAWYIACGMSDHSMIKLLYSAATQHNELSNVNVIFSLDYLYYMQAIYWESYS